MIYEMLCKCCQKEYAKIEKCIKQQEENEIKELLKKMLKDGSFTGNK